MADRGLLHPVMPGLIGYPSMWLHQQQVFEAVKAGQHVLVATGTGSGKTESFLYPIVDDLLRQRDRGVHEGLTAILVYPMNALANDQLDRLRDMLGGTGITFGQWVGTTPGERGRRRRSTASPAPAVPGLPRRPPAARDEAQAEDRAVRPLAPPEECCSEEDIRQRKPRILLTNFRQLEDPDHPAARRGPLCPGPAQVPRLRRGPHLRRCHRSRGRLPDPPGPGPGREDADEIICIGTSATLSDPTKRDADNEETARRFASRFFGVDAAKVDARRGVLRQPGMAPTAVPARRPARRRHGPPGPSPGGDHRAGRSRRDQGGGRGTDRPDSSTPATTGGRPSSTTSSPTSTSTRPPRSSSSPSGSTRRPGRPRSGSP